MCQRMSLNQIKVEYVISFSDAVFAFSITFMALSIQFPTFSSNITESELTGRLGQLLIPNIIHYIVSFMVVGVYWISYHRIFEHIRRADITLVWINLLFLLFIVLVGYFTGLLTTYGTHRIVVRREQDWEHTMIASQLLYHTVQSLIVFGNKIIWKINLVI